jgi:hypothetical protein
MDNPTRTNLRRRWGEVDAELRPLLTEQAELRTLMTAIGMDPDAELKVWQKQQAERRAFEEQQERLKKAVVSFDNRPRARVSVKFMIRKELEKHFPNGLTSNQLVELLRVRWNRATTVQDIGPTLTELKNEGRIRTENRLWYFIKEEESVPVFVTDDEDSKL